MADRRYHPVSRDISRRRKDQQPCSARVWLVSNASLCAPEPFGGGDVFHQHLDVKDGSRHLSSFAQRKTGLIRTMGPWNRSSPARLAGLSSRDSWRRRPGPLSSCPLTEHESFPIAHRHSFLPSRSPPSRLRCSCLRGPCQRSLISSFTLVSSSQTSGVDGGRRHVHKHNEALADDGRARRSSAPAFVPAAPTQLQVVIPRTIPSIWTEGSGSQG